MSIITRTIKCKLNKNLADLLNQESGRIYTAIMVEHWRVYRKHGYWIKPNQAQRYNDMLNGGSILAAHSIDAAQQGFYGACKTTHALRKSGIEGARFPYRRKHYRTTVWKNQSIRKRKDHLLLSLARGNSPIRVRLPKGLRDLDKSAFLGMRLKYDVGTRKYSWHLVINLGEVIIKSPGDKIAAIDMGEIHPIAMGIKDKSVLITCRELRANSQYRNKQLANLSRAQSRLTKGSRKWKRLQAKRNRFLAKNGNRQRDMLHKISREAINWCVENEVGKLWIGDVRNIADGKKWRRESQQKLSNWPHRKMRMYLNYKAASAGIEVNDKASERYTSQTSPCCLSRYKPKGRVYKCRTCGRIYHRDIVGYANILSLNEYGEFGKFIPEDPMYLRPVKVLSRTGGHPASSLGTINVSKKPRCFSAGSVTNQL